MPRASKGVTRRPRRVTMWDVAKDAGVSQATVSFVLNDVRKINISDATRRRVWDAARTLGYGLPRRRGAGGRASRVLGFIIDEIATTPFGVPSMDAARELAWEHDRTVMFATSGGDRELERVALQHLLDLQPEGIVYAAIVTRQVEPPPEVASLPAVLLNCYTADRRLPSVVPAEVAGGHTATARLIEAGHRRIGMINGERWMDAARDRLQGYRNALAGADLPFAPELVRHGNWELSGAFEETLALLALERPPSAIFCASDTMALGCYEALKVRGLRVPTDIAVIGYDDQWIARHMSPPLTTLILPHEEMGRWAIEHLIGRAGGGPGAPAPQVKLECPLVERASVQAVPAGGRTAGGER